MAHLARNNSGASGAISSLQMDYGDSDDDDSSSLGGSRNNSLDDREQLKDQEEPVLPLAASSSSLPPLQAPPLPPLQAPPLPPLVGLVPPVASAPSTSETQPATTSLAPQSSPPPPAPSTALPLVPPAASTSPSASSALPSTSAVSTDSPLAAPPTTDPTTEQPDTLPTYSRRIEINAAPLLQDVDMEEGDEGEEGSPAGRLDNFISDDEDGTEDKKPPMLPGPLLTDPAARDSPASLTSQPPRKAATRLVSYGPDEDLSDESEDNSEDDMPMPDIESSPEPTDPSALSRSVQNMKDDDIRIPDEPPGQCSAALQKKIEDMYDRMRREGLDLNRIIQNKKTFRNPSIYEKLIEFCHIDQKGTNFPPEIYNPHIWGKESFYDELDKAQRKDMEKREKEKKDRTKVDFVTGVKKGSSSTSDLHSDDKKRKTKWDAQPHSSSSVKAPGLVNLTSSATGTKATVISAVGVLSKSKSSSHK